MSDPKIIIGCDVGKHGAISRLAVGNEPTKCDSLEMLDDGHLDYNWLNDWISEEATGYGQATVYIELITRPVETVVMYGEIRGMFLANGIACNSVPCQTWRKEVLGITKCLDWKGEAVIKAKKLFPHVKLLRTLRCKISDHNRAEALLIAYYGWLQKEGAAQ